MTALKDFGIETYFSKWEFVVRHHMAASDAESMSIRDLMKIAAPEEREEFETTWLGYTETYGMPSLREEIASTFTQRSAEDILCFTGASEAIYAANVVLLDKDDHVIVVTPNYQSHETVPLSICAVTGIPLNPDDNWSLDLDRLKDAIRPNTKLVTINFPHNPTGAILPRAQFDALISICRDRGIYILSDEIFNGLGRSDTQHLPFIADHYERGMSINVVSKSYGLPGLRLGWIACQDRDLLSRMERMKHYLSMCGSAPSEVLAKIAIRHRSEILSKNCAIIDRNVLKLDEFFGRHSDLFEWRPSQGSSMAFPKYKGSDGVENFTKRLVEESSVFFLPSTYYQSDLGETPRERFRIGLARLNIDEGLVVFEHHLNRVKHC